MLRLIAVAALVCLIGYVGVDFDHRAIHWPLMAFYGLLAAPLLLIVYLGIWPARQRWVRAWATAIGTVAGIPLGMLGAGLALFIGFSMSTTQLYQNLFTIAFCGSIVALGLAGIVAILRAPSSDRHGMALMIAFLTMTPYAAAVWGYSKSVLGVPYDRNALISAYYERAARRDFDRLVTCIERTAQEDPARGYPARLSEVQRRSGCIGGKLSASGGYEVLSAGDYGYLYAAAPPSAQGKRNRYVLCAYPGGRYESGRRVFTRDAAGHRREAAVGAEERVPGCARVWAGDDASGYLRSVEACLYKYAAEDPRGSYPPSLFHGHADGPDLDCPGYGLTGAAVGGRGLSSFGAVEYVAGIPGPDAAIRDFELLLWDRSRPTGAWRLDADGLIEPQVLTDLPTDPDALEQARPLKSVLDARFQIGRAQFATRCDAGDLNICDHLGYLHWERSEPELAFSMWESACERGHDVSCLVSGRYNPLPSDQVGQRERCGRGEQRYCDQLAALATAEHERIRALVARGGYPSATTRFER